MRNGTHVPSICKALGLFPAHTLSKRDTERGRHRGKKEREREQNQKEKSMKIYLKSHMSQYMENFTR